MLGVTLSSDTWMEGKQGVLQKQGWDDLSLSVMESSPKEKHMPRITCVIYMWILSAFKYNSAF